MGKPLEAARGEVNGAARSLAPRAREIAAALLPDTIEDDATTTTLHFDPLGVCACITPWNFPVSIAQSSTLPALVAGNTVVLKPTEETPLVVQAWAEFLIERLPEDVLQVVHGADDQGKALVAGDVDLVAFTGSREAGRHIMGACAPGLKRMVLELGGKDPLIVLPDADPAEAAAFAAGSSFGNAGQVCVSTERIFVPEELADDFVRELAARADKLQLGDGLAPGTEMGPLVNVTQRDHVMEQIDEAVKAGAELVTGGEVRDGNFVAPTVVRNVTDAMSIMRDETFGPVACVSTYANIDEAVERANDTPFGLGAIVLCRDEEAAQSVARRLHAGMVGINKGCGGAAGSPWVGARQSGYGYRGSREGHRQFTQARLLSRPK